MKPKKILCLFLLLGSACNAIDSSELKSTKAEDLKIVGTVYEYNDETEAEVSAQMQTRQSETSIDFTLGETLSVQSEQEDETFSETTFLEENDTFLNLDQSYSGYVDKTITDGNYLITYTDPDGVATTAIFPTFSVSDITSPSNADIIDVSEPVTVTWDPESLEGTLSIVTSYSTSNSAGAHTERVANDGSVEIDISSHRGSGSIKLVHENSFNSFEGFGEAKIYMKNISKVDVTYSNGSSTLLFRESSEGLIQSCLHECREGEQESITVDNQLYDCCL